MRYHCFFLCFHGIWMDFRNLMSNPFRFSTQMKPLVEPLLILAEVLEKRRQVQCAVDLAQRRGSEKTVPKWGLWEYDGNIVEMMMMMTIILIIVLIIVYYNLHNVFLLLLSLLLLLIKILLLLLSLLLLSIIITYNKYIYIYNMHPQLLDIMV